MHLILHEIREEKGLSQSELARRSGVSQAFISQIEKGEKVPTIFIAKRIAMALDKTIDDLITM